MNSEMQKQLISYIAPVLLLHVDLLQETEPFSAQKSASHLKWYHDAFGIDFGEQWHTDAVYRHESLILMEQELIQRFGNRNTGWIQHPDEPPDLLSGTFGACYYCSDLWSTAYLHCGQLANCEHQYLRQSRSIDLCLLILTPTPFL